VPTITCNRKGPFRLDVSGLGEPSFADPSARMMGQFGSRGAKATPLTPLNRSADTVGDQIAQLLNF
jgi:hypothetical protein